MNSQLKDQIKILNFNELEELNSFIVEQILYNTPNTDLLDEISNKKYPTRIVCPHCGSVIVVKNGKTNGKQRYKCRDCEKSFGLLTNTILSGSKIPLNVWAEYAKMMLNNKVTLRDSAKKLNISVLTAFKMRHKLLDKLSMIITKDDVYGHVQMDETYVPESYKGNYKKSVWPVARKPYERGGQRTEALIDKCCIITAIDNNNNLIIKHEGLGISTSGRITTALYYNIKPDSIMITDGLPAYKSLALINGCQHEVVPPNLKINKKGYNINKVNNLHSQIKNWFRRFKGVSVKHLDSYLTWFTWLEKTKAINDIDKYKKLLVDCIAC